MADVNPFHSLGDNMNANELAEALDDLDLISGYQVVAKAQAMLRQQQAEIEALKTYKPNQTLECSFDLAGLKPPAKTLTDEEIDAVGDEVSNLIDTYAGRREFARAILRKAQEK